MPQQKPNPHHLNIQADVSLISLSFASQVKTNMTLEQILSRTSRKLRLISILVGGIYRKRLTIAFNSIKYKPLRSYVLKKRLVEVFLAMVRRSEYNKKYEGFQRIKKAFINERNQQVKLLNTVLSKARVSAMKLLTIFMKTKEKQNIETAFYQINQYAKQKYQEKCDNYRKGFKLWIKVKNSVVRKYFIKLRSSRFLTQRRLKIQSIIKVVRQYRNRCLKAGLDKLRRNLYRQRERSIREQISQMESKLSNDEDEQLRSLKQKQEQLQKSIVEIKKEKEEISQAYQTEVKQAQTKNLQIQQTIKTLKEENQQLISNIKQINEQLNQQFSMDEIFQMFYNNMLYHISRNKSTSLNKTQLIQSLTKPLIPIQIPLLQLKQENKVLKELINQYVLIYGHKSLEGKQIQIPYEYLVKENQTMYRMLVTMLNRHQYNKKDAMELRETLESVENLVKDLK